MPIKHIHLEANSNSAEQKMTYKTGCSLNGHRQLRINSSALANIKKNLSNWGLNIQPLSGS
jgi:predicted DNA binding CopG/RHH family protein